MKIKALNIVTGIAVLAGTMLLAGFSARNMPERPAGQLEVKVDHSDGSRFVDEQQIRQMVNTYLQSRKDTSGTTHQLRELEQLIAGIAHVDRAHVYRTIDGAIHIKAHQKEPLLRVINSNNESYYIDTRGGMMPLSGRYTARVMVATGHIHNPYSPVVNLREMPAGKNPDPEKRLRELFQLVEYIHGDSFWNAFIDHVYVTPNGEFELIPKNGNHIVEFGKTDRMEQKFRKLYSFYQQGLARVGWHQYKRVNLKFNNQIVCSK